MVELYNIPAGIPDDLNKNRPVVIVDIFRASTSITAALASGAKGIFVAGSTAEALNLKNEIGPDVVMAGERKGFKIEGYDLGNSPHEMTPEKVAGRTVIFNSTNGTKLLRRFVEFENVAVGSIVSLSTTVEYIGKFNLDPVICCAGREGKFSAEDTLAAGAIMSGLKVDYELDDGADLARRLIESTNGDWIKWARNSFHGRYLASIGLADDLDFCLTLDKFSFVPVRNKDVFLKSTNV